MKQLQLTIFSNWETQRTDSASSVSWKLAEGGTTRLMLAPGATAWDHSTSRLISRSGPEHWDGVGTWIMLKLDEVSMGKPNLFEKALASCWIGSSDWGDQDAIDRVRAPLL